MASRRPRRPTVAPGPRARAGCTYPSWVVPAAGARVPRVRHGADCAAAAVAAAVAAALPPGPPRSAPRGRRGSRARAASCPALRWGLGPLRAHSVPLRSRGSGRAQARLPQAPGTCDAALTGDLPPRDTNGTFQHQYGAPGNFYFFLVGSSLILLNILNNFLSQGRPALGWVRFCEEGAECGRAALRCL